MKKFTILLFLTMLFDAKAQLYSDFLKQNALDWKSESIYNSIKDYRCIMLGEQHGTKEAAEFLEHIIKLSLKNGKKVILGLEIPANDMQEFEKKATTSNLKKTLFFKQGYGDGRNNEAWFKLIDNCKNLKNLRFCFFDADSDGHYDSGLRDKIMFENLMNVYREDSTQTIFTIGANVHSKLKPQKKNKVMGCYFAEYFTEKQVLSIDHVYGDGTVFNRAYGQLATRKIKGTGAKFVISSFENYFLPQVPKGLANDNNAVVFTKTITASIATTKRNIPSSKKKRYKLIK